MIDIRTDESYNKKSLLEKENLLVNYINETKEKIYQDLVSSGSKTYSNMDEGGGSEYGRAGINHSSF